MADRTRDWSKADLTSDTDLGRVYHMLLDGWRSVRHCDRWQVLRFNQNVSDLRRIGRERGFTVEDRWEPKEEMPAGAKRRVKQHRIVWEENGGA